MIDHQPAFARARSWFSPRAALFRFASCHPRSMEAIISEAAPESKPHGRD
jgi:hypothetical protein